MGTGYPKRSRDQTKMRGQNRRHNAAGGEKRELRLPGGANVQKSLSCSVNACEQIMAETLSPDPFFRKSRSDSVFAFNEKYFDFIHISRLARTGLYMDRRANSRGHRRFAYSFRECRMRVAGAGHVFSTGTKLHGDADFMDQITSHRADDMSA